MLLSEVKLGSCSTRSILCCFIVSVAFLGTLLAGFHLETLSLSTKVSNIVIPIYGRGGRAIFSSKDRLNTTTNGPNPEDGEVNDQKEPSNTNSEFEDLSVQQSNDKNSQNDKYILKSECEERVRSIANEISDNVTTTSKNNSLSDKNNTMTSSKKSSNHGKRVNVALFAAMRTGSSFVGELLSKRNDFFYLFEPGLRIQNLLKLKNITDVILKTKYLELLDGVYRCNYTNLFYYLKYSSLTDYDNQKKHIPGLMTPKNCTYYRLDPKRNETRRFCDFITPEIAEAKCKAKKYVLVKMIRIHDINLLLPMMFDKEIKLKVIHLIRDPRGVVASRLMLYFHKSRPKIFPERYYGTTMRTIIEEYCLTKWRDVETGRYVKEIRDSYMLLRYEDVATDPYASASKMYQFLGIGKRIPAKVIEWLVNNTMETVPKSSPYSTQRNSKETAQHWRTKLTYDVIKMIENTGKCRDFMNAVGYLPVFDKDDLKRSNVSFIGEIPPYNSEKVDDYFKFSR